MIMQFTDDENIMCTENGCLEDQATTAFLQRNPFCGETLEQVNISSRELCSK